MACKKDEPTEKPIFPELRTIEILGNDAYYLPISMARTGNNKFTLLMYKKNTVNGYYSAHYLDIDISSKDLFVSAENEVFSSLTTPPLGGVLQMGQYDFTSLIYTKASYFTLGNGAKALNSFVERKDIGFLGDLKFQKLSDGYLILGISYNKLFIQKLDFNFNPVWDKSYGGPAREMMKGAVELSDGSLGIMAQTKNLGRSHYGILWLHLSATGDSLSSALNLANGTTKLVDDFCLHDSKIYVVARDYTGTALGNRIVYCMTEDGNILWEKKYGLGMQFTNIKKSKNGLLVVGTIKEKSNTSGSNDYYVCELDMNGNLLWDKKYGIPLYDDKAIAIDTDGDNYYILGTRYKVGGLYSAVFIKDKLGN